MKKYFLKIWILLAFLTATAHSTRADVFTVKPGESQAAFNLEHKIGFNSGFFRSYDGEIRLNKENSALEEIVINIKPESVETYNTARNELLQSENFFHTKKFPLAKLRCSPKKKSGILTCEAIFREKTQTVDFNYRFFGIGRDDQGNKVAAVGLNGKLNRKDFGVTYNVQNESGVDMLGDEIQLYFVLEGKAK